MSNITTDLKKFKPRPEQLEAYDFVTNNPKKFSVLELPPGTGKSHISIMLSNFFTTKNRFNKVDLVTLTKILQDQYSSTYDSPNNFKGADNYDCPDFSCTCEHGKEFANLNKVKCEFCPYDDAKNKFRDGTISLTNFHMYLTLCLYNMLSSKDTGQKRESNILIVDEAHELEEVLTGFISMKLTEKTIKSFSFDNEKELLNRLKDAADIEKYISLIKDVCQAAKNKLSTIKQDEMDNKDRNPISDQRANKLNKFYGSDSDGIKNLKLQTKLREIVSKTDIFLEKYTQNPPNWILEKVWSEATKNYEFSIDPVWVGDYMNEYVWNRYDKVILMSGTILDIDLFCQVNGLSKHEVNYKSWQSPFPIENRRTIYAPIGSMSMKDKVETFKKYIPFLTNIFNHYSGKKGVIHTNSFELSNWIERDMKKNKRLLFHTSLNKQDILIEHFESKKDSIIVSPSVGTGVDFDDDKSRFQIIAKIPYPSLASARNKRRQELNKEWYSWKTVCTLIQMMGRSIRHKEDYADTYIIDSGFGGLLYYSRKYFPKWVTDTIVDKSKQMK